MLNFDGDILSSPSNFDDVQSMLLARPQHEHDGLAKQQMWSLHDERSASHFLRADAWQSLQKTNVNQPVIALHVDEIVSDNCKEVIHANEANSENPNIPSSMEEEVRTGQNRSAMSTKDSLNFCSRQRLPTSFVEMSSVVTLNLSNNQLEAVPDSLPAFVNLVTLDLHSNHLGALPECFGMLGKLKVLNVSGNQLQSFPESIGNCSALVELDASFNQLEFLPADFGSKFVSLQRLSLQLNRLGDLPSSICNMKALKCLEVQFNKLLSLPSFLGNFQNLEVINASSNFSNLVSVPDSLGDLVSLTSLDLSYNQIRQLPASLGKLQTLETLKLEGNPLIIPPVEVLEHSHEAVMEYLAEQWKNAVLSRNEKKVVACRLNPNLSPASWMSSLLHGMCGFPSIVRRSKRKVLGWHENASSDTYVQFSG